MERGERTTIMHRYVRHGGTVYVSGTIADDLTLPMKKQTEQITAKLDRVLAAAGTSKHKLLTAQIYVTDFAAKNEMNEAWLAWLDPDILPARATIGVAELGAGVLIEVVVTAAE